VRELARTHWIGGTLSALCGALAYRFGPALVSGTFRFAVQIAGLILVTAGLFWIARGVSRTAAERAEHESD
jgi:hypothetical protein